jgi:hypothetical protein
MENTVKERKRAEEEEENRSCDKKLNLLKNVVL